MREARLRALTGSFAPHGSISVIGYWTGAANVGDAELHPCAEERYGMVMPETARKWTREMVLALPDDGNRYELFDGELLVTPSPTMPHQHAVALLWGALYPYVTTHRLGVTMSSPADLHLGGEQLSQPDLFVLPELPADRRWGAAPNPVLVIEVLSPSSARGDRLIKRRRFQQTGIPEYWIVDLDAQVIERWRPADERPEILDQRVVWHPAGATKPLVIDLRSLFREVCGTES